MFNTPNLCRHQGDQIPSIDLRVPKKANAEHEDQEGRQQTALTHQGACHHEWGAAKQSEGLSIPTKRQKGASWTRRRRCWLTTPNPDRCQTGPDPVHQQAGTEGGCAADADRGRLISRAAINHNIGRTPTVELLSQGGRDVMERTSLRQRHRQQFSTSSRDSRDRQGRRARKGSPNEAVSKIKTTFGCVPLCTIPTRAETTRVVRP